MKLIMVIENDATKRRRRGEKNKLKIWTRSINRSNKIQLLMDAVYVKDYYGFYPPKNLNNIRGQLSILLLENVQNVLERTECIEVTIT